MSSLYAVCLLLVSALALTQADNKQAWSHQAVEGQNFAIDCMPSDLSREPYVNIGDTLTWTKKGMDTELTSGEHIHIQDKDGIPNAELVFTPVTAHSAGIYLCHVSNGSHNLGFVVKGLNVAGPLYDDNIDKYRTPVITGIISGAAVCFLVCAVCFIDRFRYLTDEQKQKKRDRKQERLAKQDRIRNGGVDNPGMDLAEDATANGSYEVIRDQKEVNTHL